MTRVFRDKCAECGHPVIAASPEAVMAATKAHAEYRAWLERQGNVSEREINGPIV